MGSKKIRMYEEVSKTWSPFVGCKHECRYCVPSFQRRMKRRKKRCIKCYYYEPHFHEERLINSLGQNKFVFACDMGDVAFAETEWMIKIFNRIRNCPTNTFLIQSKNPRTFYRFEYIPENVILGTTIETNRDDIITSNNISKAPPPSERFSAMKDLGHKRKAVIVEPILDFDTDILTCWIIEINPEIVWVGYDNWNCCLPEPEITKTRELIEALRKRGIDVREKTLPDDEDRGG